MNNVKEMVWSNIFSKSGDECSTTGEKDSVDVWIEIYNSVCDRVFKTDDFANDVKRVLILRRYK